MSDYIVRAATSDFKVRAFAAVTTEMVEEARKIHNTSPVMTAALGRLLTAGGMMGTMMKNDKGIVTLKINGSGPGKGLLVTADSHAHVKGYPYEPEVLIHANAKGKLDVAGAIGSGTMQVIWDEGLKEPYAGLTQLVSGEIAEDLTYYFAKSEQIPTSVGLGVLMNRNNTVRHAGGFIIQVMPGTDEGVINDLEEHLNEITSVTDLMEAGNTPEMILENILGSCSLTILDKVPVSFSCDCSRSKVKAAVISLGRQELNEIITEGEPLEVNCHFCNSHYIFEIDDIKEILI